MTKSHYIGVDPSITNTGVVVLNSEGKYLAHLNAGAFGKDRNEIDIGRHIKQAQKITGFLDELNLTGQNISAIAWENYSYNSTHQAYSLAECNGILKAAALNYLEDKAFCYVAPMRLKKFATGNGHASKELMITRALEECKELGENPTSDICDAWFLALFAFYRANIKILSQLPLGKPLSRIRMEIVTEFIKEHSKNKRGGF